MAQEIRQIASEFGDVDRREMMHRVAENYERMARLAEAADQSKFTVGRRWNLARILLDRLALLRTA